MKIQVKVIPRSSKNEVVKQTDGSYRIKITAPPVDGEANKKLIEVISREFKVAKSMVRILRGETAKVKLVEIKER